MRWSASSVQWWNAGATGRSRRDYTSSVGDGRGNSAVVACVSWLAMTFLEAPLRLRRYDGDDLSPEPRHQLLQLLRRPNPYYSGRTLMRSTIIDRAVSGNAYWLKVRSGAGRVVELWWVPSWTMEPRWPDDGATYISHYEYKPSASAAAMRLDVADVFHTRAELDPNNPRKGLSKIATIAREIYTDDEAANFAATLLTNLGVPGTVISPADNTTEIDQDQADRIKSTFINRFTGDNRGEPLVLGQNYKVSTVTFTPEQMNLRVIRQIPEERISAVFQTPAVLVGLGAGLEHMIYSNYSEAREAAFEEHIIPLGIDIAEELMLQLVPDFEDPANVELDFDTSNIRVLQEDQNAAAQRYKDMLLSGQMTIAEVRQKWGLKPLAELIAERGAAEPDPGDVLLLPPGVKVTRIEDMNHAPELAPSVDPLMSLLAPGSADAGGDEAGDVPAPLRRVAGLLAPTNGNGHTTPA